MTILEKQVQILILCNVKYDILNKLPKATLIVLYKSC